MFGNTFNSTATYSCDNGYSLDGDSIRTCLVTGGWSGTAPTCTGIWYENSCISGVLCVLVSKACKLGS